MGVVIFNFAQGAAVCKYYQFFRRFGGIKGTNMSPDLPPVKEAGKSLGRATSDAVDSKRFHTDADKKI